MRFERGKFSLDLWQQWTEWLTRRCNWYNFTFVELSVEDDQGCGQVEVQISLIGFCARLVYAHSVGPQLQIAIDRMNEIKRAAE